MRPHKFRHSCLKSVCDKNVLFGEPAFCHEDEEKGSDTHREQSEDRTLHRRDDQVWDDHLRRRTQLSQGNQYRERWSVARHVIAKCQKCFVCRLLRSSFRPMRSRWPAPSWRPAAGFCFARRLPTFEPAFSLSSWLGSAWPKLSTHDMRLWSTTRNTRAILPSRMR